MTTNAAQEEFDQLFGDKNKENRHPEDRDNSEDQESEPEEPETYHEHDDLDEEPFQSSQQGNMRSKYFLPRQRSEANTGPKGVIADAQAFEAAKRRRTFSFKKSSPPRDTYKPAALPKHWEHAAASSEEEDDDDDFMEQWRQKRLQELKVPAHHKKNGSGGSQNLAVKMYGRLIGVEAEGFLEAVESTPDDTVVAVYIYDDMSDVSLMVEECIRQLARNHTNTRFIKLHFEEAEMEVMGVPALLAYRGGNKFAGLVPLMDEIPDDAELSATTLEIVLKKYQIIT